MSLTPVSWVTDVPASQQQVHKYINYSVPTRSITSSVTLTTRQVLDSAGYPILMGTGAGVTFPTAANMVAACRSPAVGNIVLGRIINNSGGGITFGASTGVTYSTGLAPMVNVVATNFIILFTNVTLTTEAYSVFVI